MTDLFCPNCGLQLNKIGGSLLCENAHCFDIAKDGYVNLLVANAKHSKDPGDNKVMIAARKLLMESGYYKKLSATIASLIGKNCHNILDIGAGEGYLSRQIYNSDNSRHIVGIDISKYAIIAATKANKNVTYAVASANKLPVGNDWCDIAINVFAPFFQAELLRVLKKSGLFIKVIPSANHLFSLKAALYDNPYQNDVDVSEIIGLQVVNKVEVEDTFTATGDTLSALIAMTPYSYTTSLTSIKKVVTLQEVTTELAFTVLVYKVI